MKSILILIAFIGMTTSTFAQTKPKEKAKTEIKADTAKKPAKPVYDYYVKVPVITYRTLIQVAGMYKEAVIYVPKNMLNSDQKNVIQIQLNDLLLQPQPKVDSVLRK